MDFTTITVSIFTFVAILGTLVFLRTRNNKIDIRSTDIIVAILPVLIVLLVSGKIQKFEVSESGVKIETAFMKASESTILSQVTPLKGLPTEPLRIDPKAGVANIPQLIERKTEGLLFRLGQGNYFGPAVEEYFYQLARQPFLKYLVIENQDGSFFAMADARELTAMLLSPNPPFRATAVAKWLNEGDTTALRKLPGFISADDAMLDADDKRAALQKMETLNVDTLPVMTAQHRYAGIVTRSRLVASLIIDVSNELGGKQ